MTAMARSLAKLSATIGKILKARGMQNRLHEYRIFRAWPEAVGKGVARHAQPVAIRGNKLTLVVDSPAWMQQLSLLKPVILEKLNGALGFDAVKDLVLKFGEVEQQLPDAVPEPLPGGMVTSDEHEKIERSLKGIDDADLRETMRRVFEKDVLSKKRVKQR
jgi:hypothetical protein